MSTFYKVQTGFQIVDSNGVPGTPIDGISGELTESVSKLPTDKAVYDAIEAAKQECKANFEDSEEVEIEGEGTEESPYTLDLTGKVHSSTGVDLQSEEGSDVTLFSSLDIGATATRNMDIRTGYELDAYAPSIMRVGTDGHLYVTSPNEFHYNITKFAIAQSTNASAKKIEFDGSISELITSRRTTADGLISETASGPVSISSSGATATFQGAGPTTVESTGGAPVTVKSTGNASNYSSLVVNPNSGTLSVNASSRDHTLSMFSKSVVDNNTNYAQIDLNDSSGVNIHTNASPINITSEGGAQITTKVNGDTTHYSTIESQVTQVRITTAGATSPTNLTVSGNGSTSSITGYAKNITMLGAAVQGDGTPSFRAGTINGNTSIEGSSISLIGAPNGGLLIDSNGTRIIDPLHPVSISSDTFAVNVKYDDEEQHYSSSIDMGTNASLSSYNTVGLYNNESGSSLELPNNGKIVGEAYGDIDLEAHDGSHAILKGTGSSGGSDWEAKLDLNFNSSTLSSNAGPINITNTGSSIYLTSVGLTSITAPTVNITANGGPLNLVNSVGSTINLSSSQTLSESESSSSIQLTPATLGYTATYHSGTGADEQTHNTQVSVTPTEILMSIQNPVGGPSATHKTSSVLLTSNNTMEISNTDHIILSGVTDVKQDTEWSLKGFYYNDTYGSNLTLGGICTLSCATGPINITDSCGAPIYLKVEGDSTHYTTIIENVTGLSASVTGASSPLSFSMSGSSGQSSISLSAKSVSLMASTIPTDTGNATVAIGGPTIGTLLFNTTGVSLINPTLPTSITTTELKLPAYNNAFDSTTTHKVMTYAYSDAGVELAMFADLTNEQFGLDENTEAGTMFWVNMTGASADTPEVETLDPGSVGQVLTIGSDGLPEWANGGGGGMVNPMTSYGDIIVGGASGEPEALASGTEGQVLTVGSSGLEWATPGGGTNWYLGVFTSATRPSTPTEGQYGYDTTIDCVIWYIGNQWKNAAGAIV